MHVSRHAESRVVQIGVVRSGRDRVFSNFLPTSSSLLFDFVFDFSNIVLSFASAHKTPFQHTLMPPRGHTGGRTTRSSREVLAEKPSAVNKSTSVSSNERSTRNRATAAKEITHEKATDQEGDKNGGRRKGAVKGSKGSTGEGDGEGGGGNRKVRGKTATAAKSDKDSEEGEGKRTTKSENSNTSTSATTEVSLGNDSTILAINTTRAPRNQTLQPPKYARQGKASRNTKTSSSQPPKPENLTITSPALSPILPLPDRYPLDSNSISFSSSIPIVIETDSVEVVAPEYPNETIREGGRKGSKAFVFSSESSAVEMGHEEEMSRDGENTILPPKSSQRNHPIEISCASSSFNDIRIDVDDIDDDDERSDIAPFTTNQDKGKGRAMDVDIDLNDVKSASEASLEKVHSFVFPPDPDEPGPSKGRVVDWIMNQEEDETVNPEGAVEEPPSPPPPPRQPSPPPASSQEEDPDDPYGFFAAERKIKASKLARPPPQLAQDFKSKLGGSQSLKGTTTGDKEISKGKGKEKRAFATPSGSENESSRSLMGLKRGTGGSGDSSLASIAEVAREALEKREDRVGATRKRKMESDDEEEAHREMASDGPLRSAKEIKRSTKAKVVGKGKAGKTSKHSKDSRDVMEMMPRRRRKRKVDKEKASVRGEDSEHEQSAGDRIMSDDDEDE